MNIDKLRSNKAEFSKNIYKGLALLALATAALGCVLGGGGDSDAVKTQNAYGATATYGAEKFHEQLTAMAQTSTPEPSRTSTPFQPLPVTPVK